MQTTLLSVSLVAALIAIAWLAATARIRKEQSNEWEHKFWQAHSDLSQAEEELKELKGGDYGLW